MKHIQLFEDFLTEQELLTLNELEGVDFKVDVNNSDNRYKLYHNDIYKRLLKANDAGKAMSASYKYTSLGKLVSAKYKLEVLKIINNDTKIARTSDGGYDHTFVFVKDWGLLDLGATKYKNQYIKYLDSSGIKGAVDSATYDELKYELS